MAETKTYNEVFNYLRDNEYPIDFSKDQKRNLRKKALKYVLEDGALYFIGQKKGEPKRWVHCQDEQQKILRACHSDKLAGHFGRDKTREKRWELPQKHKFASFFHSAGKNTLTLVLKL